MFVSVCEQSGCIVKPRLATEALRCTNPANLNGRNLVSCLAFIQNVRFRGSKTNERIQLLLRSHETMSADCSEMERSHVTVAYLEAANKTAHLLQSVHYDYEGTVQAAHPWFHAQLGSDYLDDAERRKLECGFTILTNDHGPAKTLRVATPHMGLLSVLLGLAADHLELPLFRQLIERTQRHKRNFVRPRLQRLRTRLERRPFDFMNVHWFDESH